MGKVKTKGKYVSKVGLYDIYVLATKKPDSTKKDGYSMIYDFNIYLNGKLIEKGLKSKEAAVAKVSSIVPKKQKS